jgi:nucleoid-associated protein YgaU
MHWPAAGRSMTGLSRSYVLVCALALLATPATTQAADPFQSAPGPAAPKPAHRATPPAPESEPADPQPVAPQSVTPQPAAPPPAVVAPVSTAVFNGTYKGGAPPISICNGTAEEWHVSDGSVSGMGADRVITWSIQGKISGDGSFTGLHGGTQTVIGKFQNGSFEGTYLSTNLQCGRRTLMLRRDSSR